jgi:hypothetical protein
MVNKDPRYEFSASRLRSSVIAALLLLATICVVVADPQAKSERVVEYEFIGPDQASKEVLISIAQHWLKDAGVSLDEGTSRTLVVGITARIGHRPNTSTTTDETEILSLEQYREFKWPRSYAFDETLLSVLVVERGTTSTTVLFAPRICASDLEEDSSAVAENINAHHPWGPPPKRSASERVINYESVPPDPSSKWAAAMLVGHWMGTAGVSLDDETSRTLIVVMNSFQPHRTSAAATSEDAKILPTEEYRNFRWKLPNCDDCALLGILVIDRETTSTNVLFIRNISAMDLEGDASPVAANIWSLNQQNLPPPTPPR